MVYIELIVKFNYYTFLQIFRYINNLNRFHYHLVWVECFKKSDIIFFELFKN